MYTLRCSWCECEFNVDERHDKEGHVCPACGMKAYVAQDGEQVKEGKSSPKKEKSVTVS